MATEFILISNHKFIFDIVPQKCIPPCHYFAQCEEYGRKLIAYNNAYCQKGRPYKQNMQMFENGDTLYFENGRILWQRGMPTEILMEVAVNKALGTKYAIVHEEYADICNYLDIKMPKYIKRCKMLPYAIPVQNLINEGILVKSFYQFVSRRCTTLEELYSINGEAVCPVPRYNAIPTDNLKIIRIRGMGHLPETKVYQSKIVMMTPKIYIDGIHQGCVKLIHWRFITFDNPEIADFTDACDAGAVSWLPADMEHCLIEFVATYGNEQIPYTGEYYMTTISEGDIVEIFTRGYFICTREYPALRLNKI